MGKWEKQTYTSWRCPTPPGPPTRDFTPSSPPLQPRVFLHDQRRAHRQPWPMAITMRQSAGASTTVSIPSPGSSETPPRTSILLRARLVRVLSLSGIPGPDYSQRPVKFASKDYLLEALKQSCKSNQTIDFHGSYELVESNVTHKQRVQSLTMDIWRATGYRFTFVPPFFSVNPQGSLIYHRVKDHPRINNGHKTRFWCSQDEAHRSKSSKLARLPNSASKPRISSAGEALAKARYACKSRLLISSRDPSSIGGGNVITIRLHHHVAHEPYVDASFPPELARAVYESFGWPSNSHDATTTPSSSTTTGNVPGFTESDADTTFLPFGTPDPDDAEENNHADAVADPDEDMDGDEDELTSSAIAPVETLPPAENPSPLSVRPPTSASTLVAATSNVSSADLPIAPSVIVSTPTSSLPTQGQSLIQKTSSPNSIPSNPPNVNSRRINSIFNNRLTTLSPSSTSSSNPINTNHVAPDPRPQDQQHLYQQRMRAHISNIREFCSGLEYQLQFDDYRMLDVLEREGGSFLRLVQDCLRKEGRLDPDGEC